MNSPSLDLLEIDLQRSESIGDPFELYSRDNQFYLQGTVKGYQNMAALFSGSESKHGLVRFFPDGLLSRQVGLTILPSHWFPAKLKGPLLFERRLLYSGGMMAELILAGNAAAYRRIARHFETIIDETHDFGYDETLHFHVDSVPGKRFRKGVLCPELIVRGPAPDLPSLRVGLRDLGELRFDEETTRFWDLDCYEHREEICESRYVTLVRNAVKCRLRVGVDK